MFDWIGSNPWWFALICVALLVVLGLIAVFVLQRRSQGTIEPENMLEALRLLNTSRMDDSVLKLLGSQLPNWPISTEIMRAVKELQTLRAGIDDATRSGVLTTQAVEFKQNTLRALDQMWHVSGRVAALGVQKVQYNAVENELQPELAQIRKMRETAKQVRLSLGQTRTGSEDGSLEEAITHLREMSEAANAMQTAEKEVREDGA
ncbi:MAG TPA: hypothetical protein VLQ48_01905 [Chloroflexia bacterium]|nr:hypothetical protein [Chloroflexia bacterium]